MSVFVVCEGNPFKWILDDERDDKTTMQIQRAQARFPCGPKNGVSGSVGRNPKKDAEDAEDAESASALPMWSENGVLDTRKLTPTPNDPR